MLPDVEDDLRCLLPLNNQRRGEERDEDVLRVGKLTDVVHRGLQEGELRIGRVLLAEQSSAPGAEAWHHAPSGC